MRTRTTGSVSLATVVAIGAVCAALIVGASTVSWAVGIKNHAVSEESTLTGMYAREENELSTYVLTIYEQAGIADRKSEKLSAILKDAVRGRYEGEGGGFGKSSPLFKAIAEAYPDLSGLDVYDRIAEQVSAGRTAYKNKQDARIDRATQYKAWLNRGLLQPTVLSWMHFPSTMLQAKAGRELLAEGPKALEYMTSAVVESSTKEAYRTGELKAVNPFSDKK